MDMHGRDFVYYVWHLWKFGICGIWASFVALFLFWGRLVVYREQEVREYARRG